MKRTILAALLALAAASPVSAQMPWNFPGTGLIVTTVSPENYGALGNGVKTFDGVVTATGTVATANNASTALNAPAVTTVNANDVVLSIFANGVGYSASPAPTNTRASVNFSSGLYGIMIGDQAVASPGSVSAVTSTLSAATGSAAATFALQPAASTISFIAGSTFSHASASRTPYSLTKPTGTAAGDYTVACFTWYTAGYSRVATIIPTNSTGWSMILSQSNAANPNLICYGHFAGASEPATYTFAANNGVASGMSAAMVDYRGVAGVEAMSQTLTSATANFSTNNVGYPICVAGEFGLNRNSYTNSAYYFAQQVCGTITAVNSATSVQVSMYLPESGTNLPIAFGHDDTANFNTMLSTAPCTTTGCTVKLGMKHYITTGQITLPINAPINIDGAGAVIPNTVNNLTGTNGALANATGGSTITMLAYAGGVNSAILVGSRVSGNTEISSYKLSNFAIVGGVGNYADGGGYNSNGTGTDGIDIFSTQLLELSHVMIANFAGNGVYIDGVTSGTTWTENIACYFCYIGMNGGSGLLLGSGSNNVFVEATALHNTVIEGNGQAAVTIAGTGVYGFSATDCTIQWDDVFSISSYEINVTGAVFGGYLAGNYFETSDGGYGSPSSTLLVSPTSGAAGLQFANNLYWGGGLASGYAMPTFSAAGTALPSATHLGGVKQVVSDATACTAGTTYASGGSTRCVVISNAANWIETGVAY